MAGRSTIEWTEATWNPVTGCDIVSPGCKNCYAKTFAERFRGVKGHVYEQGFDLKLWPDRLALPLHWKKPRRVFVNSMSDLFHEGVPDHFISAVFTTIAACPQHTFQILTKRPERMLKYFAAIGGSSLHPLPNVWLGVSVENQTFAEKRIPLLLETPAAVRWVSLEPLLGPVDLTLRADPRNDYFVLDTLRGVIRVDGRNEPLLGGPRLDWVVVGGESGPGARPFDIAWARQIIAQCKAAGVPVFMKQVGRNVLIRNDQMDQWPEEGGLLDVEEVEGPMYQGETIGVRTRDRKGGDPSEWPSDLRVREWPKGG